MSDERERVAVLRSDLSVWFKALEHAGQESDDSQSRAELLALSGEVAYYRQQAAVTNRPVMERGRVPVEAASWIVQALMDPAAKGDEVTDVSAAAIFRMVRHYDATGYGWGGEKSQGDQQ